MSSMSFPDGDALFQWGINNNLNRIATALERLADLKVEKEEELRKTLPIAPSVWRFPAIEDPDAEPGTVEVVGPNGDVLGHIDLKEVGD